jgi:hypothetical protein
MHFKVYVSSASDLERAYRKMQCKNYHFWACEKPLSRSV